MNWLDPIFLSTLLASVIAGVFVYFKYVNQCRPIKPLVKIHDELVVTLRRTKKPVLLARTTTNHCCGHNVLIAPEIYRTIETYHIFLDFLEDDETTENFETNDNGDITVYPPEVK